MLARSGAEPPCSSQKNLKKFKKKLKRLARDRLSVQSSPNERSIGRKVDFATCWQVRADHVPILVHLE
jgi:endonuclease/exonuclease/phosphatase family metal-dependent hydrolase